MNNQYLVQEYKSRINHVMDFIEENISKDMSLEELAKIANFSKFHFHRIFYYLVGETLNHFIQRIRIEKAASLLLTHPNITITEIAFSCGFSNSSVFARAFKSEYGISASAWRLSKLNDQSNNDQKLSNIGQMNSNRGEAEIISSYYISTMNHKQIWRIKMNNQKELLVEIKELEDFSVAYVRHIGQYKGDSALFGKLINKLLTWAGPRGLINFPDSWMLNVYHDNPELTDENKLRLSVCLKVPGDTEVSGEIGKMKINGGKYAFVRFELAEDEYSEAWEAVYRGWLPNSGFQPADQPPFELLHNDPKTHPDNKCIVDICVPVTPL
jgi:AraC family transcriptional regulator